MVPCDRFTKIIVLFNRKTTEMSKNYRSKKVNTHPKIPKMYLDFFRLFRPKNKLSQFDYKIRAKSI